MSRRKMTVDDIDPVWAQRLAFDKAFGEASEDIPLPYNCINCDRITDEDFEGLDKWLKELHSHHGEQLTCEDCVDCGKCILQQSYGVLLCQYIQVEEEI